MNRLARAKSLSHMMFPSPSPKNPISFTHPIISIQRPILYCTRTANPPKTQQSTKPKSQKSLTFSQRVKKQVENLTAWPRPTEIPYQAKVANLVNLIGHVKIPVKFEVASDGKHLAATVISHEQEGEKNCLLIPVLFEGDLAHVVACHVKENDCVFVSGQLSVDPMKLVLSENIGKFHVIVENVNFVEGFNRPVWKKKGGISSGVEFDKNVISRVATNLEEVKMYSDGNEGESSFGERSNLDKGNGKRGENDRKKKGVINSGVEIDNNIISSVTKNSEEIKMYSDGNEGESSFRERDTLERGNGVRGENDGKKKDGELWRDVVINPLQWWDYRGHKSNGLVKEKFPDFKHKVTGESLWVNSAPDWVLAGLGKLEFDVKSVYVKKETSGVGAGEMKKEGKGDDSWKNLVENPEKWWDNRVKKRNPKAPDFKHKETGEVLWLNRSPVWALSKLPPLRESGNL